MSELDTRPAPTRGRASTRGGHRGLGRGGPRSFRKPVNGATPEAQVEEPLEEQGEFGEMRRKYHTQLPVLKDMFTDWTDVDLLFALQECDGDLAATVDRISQGNVSQFSEVKKSKDRARSKVKEEPAAVTSEKPASTRGRGRGGIEGSRGRGGRAADRGRGSYRGGRGSHASTNGTWKEQDGPSIPTTESSAWSTAVEPENVPELAAPVEETVGSNAQKKTWASMFSQPPKPLAAARPAPQAPTLGVQAESPTEPTPAAPATSDLLTEDTQPAILATALIDEAPTAYEDLIPPSKNPFTQENVEHLPDVSQPPATHTAASTVDSNDPRNLTPLPGQQAPIGRPPLGGFAASAQRAASGSLRSASFQRRVQEQQEPVVMPGHSAVDRASVQFGSMGLNGEPGLDVDEQREEPETRQAPQHSPPSQPKTSLPSSSRQTASTVDVIGSDSLLTKQAPGLPPASQLNQPQMQESALSQGLQQDHAQHGYAQNQYGGYGQSTPQQDNVHQKPYDPFGSQSQHPQYDRFGQHSQAPQQSSQQGHAGFGGLPSGQHDYASYYNSEQQRYNQYYGTSNYASQDNRGQVPQQDANLVQQRATSGYGSAPNDQAYSAQQQARYIDSANSGHNTPNPLMGQQQNNQSNQSAQLHHQQGQTHHQQQPQPQQQQSQQQQQQQHPYGTNAAGFPYGHPYFNSPYAQAYQNQFGFSGYGGGYPSKTGGVYGGPQGYAQSSYDQHSSSPANSNAFAQNQQSGMRSGSGVSSGLGGNGPDEYGRSTQPSSQASFGAGMHDPFARTPSGFGQGGYGGQTSAAGVEDSLKPFADSKPSASPAMSQPGRSGSDANNSAAAGQSGQPQHHSQQGGFGGYSGYPAQNSQYGGLGGLGHQQGQTQQSQYSQYGSGAFSQYGSYNSRGGWGQSYGGH